MAVGMIQETGPYESGSLKNQIYPGSNKMRDQALFPRLETGVNTDDIILTTFVNGSYRRIDDRSKCTDSGFDQASIKPKRLWSE